MTCLNCERLLEAMDMFATQEMAKAELELKVQVLHQSNKRLLHEKLELTNMLTEANKACLMAELRAKAAEDLLVRVQASLGAD